MSPRRGSAHVGGGGAGKGASIGSSAGARRGSPRARASRPGAHVVLVGAGGNIGSHLVPHLGRMAGLTRVTLVDPGRYETPNLASQDIAARDVGHGKARVQARRLARIAPGLAVEALAAAVEDLPLGRLRADAIVTALDSRAARQIVNDAAFHLGVPWVDTGVMGERLLARVNVHVPGPQAPCLECAWDDRDYAALEVAYPCRGEAGAPATGAPSYLGALAAALAAPELRRLLDGDRTSEAIGRQVIVDAARHRTTVTALARRAACRRADHDAWSITRLARGPRRITLAELVAPGSRRRSEAAAAIGARRQAGEAGPPAPPEESKPLFLAVEGRRIARRAACGSCGREREGPRVIARHRPPGRCRRCGGAIAVAGFDLAERIELAALGPAASRRTLASFGVRAGDVLRLEAASGAVLRYGLWGEER